MRQGVYETSDPEKKKALREFEKSSGKPMSGDDEDEAKEKREALQAIQIQSDSILKKMRDRRRTRYSKKLSLFEEIVRVGVPEEVLKVMSMVMVITGWRVKNEQEIKRVMEKLRKQKEYLRRESERAKKKEDDGLTIEEIDNTEDPEKRERRLESLKAWMSGEVLKRLDQGIKLRRAEREHERLQKLHARLAGGKEKGKPGRDPQNEVRDITNFLCKGFRAWTGRPQYNLVAEMLCTAELEKDDGKAHDRVKKRLNKA